MREEPLQPRGHAPLGKRSALRRGRPEMSGSGNAARVGARSGDGTRVGVPWETRQVSLLSLFYAVGAL
jgi:hypothetical protein